MDFAYTRHQVARSTRPDGEEYAKLHLIKNVSELVLTYQIKLLTFKATEERKKLTIHVPNVCTIEKALKDFVSANKKVVQIERF